MDIINKIKKIKYNRMTPREMMKYFIVDGVETTKVNERLYYQKDSVNVFYFRKFAFTEDNKYGEIVFNKNLFYRLRKKLQLTTDETDMLIIKTINFHFGISITEFSINYL